MRTVLDSASLAISRVKASDGRSTGGPGNGSKPTARAALPSGSKADLEAYTITALEPGAEGDALSVEIKDAPEKKGGDEGDKDKPDNAFTVVVKKGGKPVEAGKDPRTGDGDAA